MHKGMVRLSPRQREVLALRRRGLIVKEVAAELHISVPTVKVHCARAFLRLRARSLAEALFRICQGCPRL